MKENHLRSIVKAISWRFFATLTTAIIVFIYTGTFIHSIGVSIEDIFSKIVLYYFHERIWTTINFGKSN